MILDAAIPSKSGRLTLVPPLEADDAATAALRCRPETRRYLRFFPEHVSPSEARARRLSRAPDQTLVDFNIHALNAAADAKSTFVGTTGIFRIDLEYGSSCEERKIHRAEFQTGVDNLAMRGWLEKAGATLEGKKRDRWSDPTTGGYTDVCMYSILEEEWMATVKGRLEERINRVVG
ncbi:hypothetical protein B0H19DRAFT_1147128 [Mycena capillaripes]|nr:hypothetical protein B0H19DRAFT_1147128 [Mycena capillaripes]